MNTSRSDSRASAAALDYLAGGFFLTFSIAFIAFIMRAVPEVFDLHPTPYAIWPALALVANTTLLGVLLRYRIRTEPMVWLSLLVVDFLIWSLFEVCERSMVDAGTTLFWSQSVLSAISYAPAFFYLFVRSYTDRGQTSGRLVVPVLTIGLSTMIATLVAGNGVMSHSSISAHLAWGYPAPITPVSLLVVGWIISAMVLGCIQLMSHYGRTTAKDRKQTRLIMISTAILALVGGFANIILPAYHVFILPVGVIANAVWAGCIIFGVYRYGSFSVNVPIVAEGILSTMAESMVVTDQSYRIVYANRRAEEVFGDDHRMVIGQSLREVVDGKLFEHRHEWEDDIRAYGYSEIPELDLTTPRSRFIATLHVRSNIDLYKGYVFSLSDITDLKTAVAAAKAQATDLARANMQLKKSQTAMINLLEDAHDLEVQLKHERASIEHKVVARTSELELARARLEASINSLDVGFIMTDRRGRYLTINGEVPAIITGSAGLRRDSRELDREAVASVLDRTFDLSAKVERCIKTAQPIHEPNLTFGDRIVSIFIAPILDHHTKSGTPFGAIIVLEDVTESVTLQRSRDEFFSIASHELRTPLTAIRGNAQIISRYYGDSFKDPQLKEMLSDIHDSSVRLIQIVNDFLDTSRLEQGHIQFKYTKFPVEELLDQVAKEYQASGVMNDLYLHIDTPDEPLPLVVADHDRLRQVLTNLIGNGIKFTKHGGITLIATVDGDAVQVRVRDTGEGIPADSKSVLFRKFQQASNNLTRDTASSTGLGLYISRLIMAGMHGDIQLESSQVGRGSTFLVTIPTKVAKREDTDV